MKNRLEEIEKQSYTEVMHERGGTYMAFDKQKFAELIVRECADKIGENFVGAVGTHASAYNSAVLKCQTIIKEHFGVEDVD